MGVDPLPAGGVVVDWIGWTVTGVLYRYNRYSSVFPTTCHCPITRKSHFNTPNLKAVFYQNKPLFTNVVILCVNPLKT